MPDVVVPPHVTEIDPVPHVAEPSTHFYGTPLIHPTHDSLVGLTGWEKVLVFGFGTISAILLVIMLWGIWKMLRDW